jgi:hypothetical protein
VSPTRRGTTTMSQEPYAPVPTMGPLMLPMLADPSMEKPVYRDAGAGTEHSIRVSNAKQEMYAFLLQGSQNMGLRFYHNHDVAGYLQT